MWSMKLHRTLQDGEVPENGGIDRLQNLVTIMRQVSQGSRSSVV